MPQIVATSSRVTITSGQITSQPERSDRNAPIDWIPSLYLRHSVTEGAKMGEEAAEEESWADLAAHARAAWSRDNPF